MRRAAALLVLGVSLAGAPAAAADCPRKERVERQSKSTPAGYLMETRERVVACVRGRERIFRRVFWKRTTIHLRGDGSSIRQIDARAGRLAIAAHHSRRGRRRTTIELFSLRTGRRLFFWERRGTNGTSVVLDRRGRLAWSHLGLVRVRGVGGGVAVRGRGDDLRVEDGVTLHFGHRYLDLEPLPMRNGCPVRSRFRPRTTFERDGMRVAAIEYHPGDDSDNTETLVLACLHGTGRDVVVGSADSSMSGGSVLTAVGIDAPFVVLDTYTWSKYHSYAWELSAVDARTGTVTRTAYRTNGDCQTPPGCELKDLLPTPGAPVVVTTSGAPAWSRGGVVRAIGRENMVIELDRGRIEHLRAEGDVVRWTRDGMERSATL